MKIVNACGILFYSLLLLSIHCHQPVISDNEYEKFIRRQGNLLVHGTDNSVITLQGVAFGNNVWALSSTPPPGHHSEIDFQRVKDMGMNAIRFYMSYKYFEDDINPYAYKQSGWDWLDQNIAWAKKHGIYLILNMHVPQGGFQSLGNGTALWEDTEIQNRLKALWKAIAQHCKSEIYVAAYDLVNEPVSTSSIDQWKDLANALILEIRKEDSHHLIVVEKLLGVKDQWETYSDPATQFLVNDNNVMYQFHTYHPIEYTHQNTSWTTFGEGGKYPDEDVYQLPTDLTWQIGVYTNPKLPSGDSSWATYTGVHYQITDPDWIVAQPVFSCSSNSGTAYFDDFVIKEYDPANVFVRDIMIYNVDATTGSDFALWTDTGMGSLSHLMTEGYTDSYSMSISGSTGLSSSYFYGARFPVQQNYRYEITGAMRGENMSPGSSCGWSLDIMVSPSGDVVRKRNKENLEHYFNQWFQFGIDHDVPMYVGEFGVYKDCFQNAKGGIDWVNDMVDIILDHQAHFTYHSYHEDAFGIYNNNPTVLPNPAYVNQPLVDLFTAKLN